MALEIGLNKGYKLVGAEVNEKGSIDVTFAKGESQSSLLDMLAAEVAAEESSIIMFPPNLVKYKDNTPRRPKDIVNDLRRGYRIFYKIFNLYVPKDQLEQMYPVTAMYNGITITPEKEVKVLTTEATVKKIWANLGIMVGTIIKNLDLANKEALRLKLIRQSANKPYPAFVFKVDRDDWVDLITVPDNLTKVKFTDWEISKGYNNAAPPIADTTQNAPEGGFANSTMPPINPAATMLPETGVITEAAPNVPFG